MATAIERLEDFKERLLEMQLDNVVITGQASTPDRYNIVVEEHKNFDSDIAQYAVLGLVFHFINRKWCKDIAYMYIMKSHLHITFTNESD